VSTSQVGWRSYMNVDYITPDGEVTYKRIGLSERHYEKICCH